MKLSTLFIAGFALFATACATTSTDTPVNDATAKTEDSVEKFVGYDENGKKVTAEDAEKRGKVTKYVKEKKICRVYDEIGTRMGRTRVCKTKTEWAVADDKAKDSARQMGRGIRDPRNDPSGF